MADTRNDAVPHPSVASRIGLVLGPLLLLLTLILPPPGDMSHAAWGCVGMALLMASWWSTEAIPIPVTSLIPLVLAPALGIGGIKDIAASYANPIIYLFLGGFLLGIAMQTWNLHKRIALHVLKVVGSEPRRQIAGFMIATGFLSMWVSNTATAIMMLPIGISVLSLMEDSDPKELRRFATALLLGIAYSASIGGVATLIGTPPQRPAGRLFGRRPRHRSGLCTVDAGRRADQCGDDGSGLVVAVPQGLRAEYRPGRQRQSDS